MGHIKIRTGHGPAWGKIIAAGVVLLACFLSWRYTPLAKIVTVQRVVEWARSAGGAPWAPLLVLVLYTPAAFLMFPRPLLTLFSVIAFGQWRGFAISVGGIVLSALTAYLVGRRLPEKTVHRVAGRNLERTTRAIRRRGLLSAFAVSVAPVAPFPVVGMVAGAVRIKLWQYLAGTALGMMPGTIATTVFARQIEAALENPGRINYWVIAAVLAVLVLLIVGVRRWMLSVHQHA